MLHRFTDHQVPMLHHCSLVLILRSLSLESLDEDFVVATLCKPARLLFVLTVALLRCFVFPKMSSLD